MSAVPSTHRRALLSSDTSRQNKLWLAAGWAHHHGWQIEHRWAGEPMKSRLCFRFDGVGEFAPAKSFDEDIMPTFEFNKERKAP